MPEHLRNPTDAADARSQGGEQSMESQPDAGFGGAFEYNSYSQYMNSAYFPPQGGGYAPHMMGAPHQYGYPHGAGGRGKRRYQAGPQQQQHPRLPENERCTLRCTKIRHYITDAALKAHFESFGHVVEMRVNQMNGRDNGEDVTASAEDGASEKQPDKECLVQFYSAANAKKCYNSPIPVVNNRFIVVQFSHFNIVPLTDVAAPPPEIIERDRQIVSGELKLRIKSTDGDGKSKSGAADPAAKRKHSAASAQDKAATFKYRRIEAESTAATGATGADTSPATAASAAAVDVQSPKAAALTKANEEIKEKFDKLKTLRSQKEEIWKKKENLLQVRRVLFARNYPKDINIYSNFNIVIILIMFFSGLPLDWSIRCYFIHRSKSISAGK